MRSNICLWRLSRIQLRKFGSDTKPPRYLANSETYLFYWFRASTILPKSVYKEALVNDPRFVSYDAHMV